MNSSFLLSTVAFVSIGIMFLLLLRAKRQQNPRIRAFLLTWVSNAFFATSIASLLGLVGVRRELYVGLIAGAAVAVTITSLRPAFVLSLLEPTKVGFSCSLGILRAFRWFCRSETRDVVEMALSDIKRDVRAMTREGRSPWFIRLAVFWQTIGTIVPIMWDGVRRTACSFGPIVRWLLQK